MYNTNVRGIIKIEDIIDETVRLVVEDEILCEMANLSFKSTGLSVDIWSDMAE